MCIASDITHKKWLCIDLMQPLIKLTLLYQYVFSQQAARQDIPLWEWRSTCLVLSQHKGDMPLRHKIYGRTRQHKVPYLKKTRQRQVALSCTAAKAMINIILRRSKISSTKPKDNPCWLISLNLYLSNHQPPLLPLLQLSHVSPVPPQPFTICQQ